MFIYETCVLLSHSAGDDAIQQIVSLLEEVVGGSEGEVLLTDKWGGKTLAQPTVRGVRKGFYIYSMYLADGQVNGELERRYRINELVLKHIIVKKGMAREKEELLKAYVTPYASNSAHHPPQSEEVVMGERERMSFSRRGERDSQASKKGVDWKNPQTYRWFVNDFGKIAPARVTGLSSIGQRRATIEIKRARNMGLISHIDRNIVT